MASPERERSWELLKAISIARPGDVQHEIAESLLYSGELDCDALIGMASRHTLVEALAAFIEGVKSPSGFSNRTLRHLSNTLWANRVATANYLAEADRIRSRLADAGIRFAFTKGVICQQSLYGATGARAFNDIDLMARREDSSVIADAMKSLGFLEKQVFNFEKNAFEPMPREKLAVYRLSPDHLPHYMRTNPGGLPRIFRVDVALSMTWHASNWVVPVSRVLEQIRLIECGDADSRFELPSLEPEFDLLFHVLHLFREGWTERVAFEKDLRLSQFADVKRGWDALGDKSRETLRSLIGEYEVHAPVAWVLHHVDAVFGSALMSECGLEGRFGDDWTSSMSVPGGSRHWHGDMERRLRDATL